MAITRPTRSSSLTPVFDKRADTTVICQKNPAGSRRRAYSLQSCLKGASSNVQNNLAKAADSKIHRRRDAVGKLDNRPQLIRSPGLQPGEWGHLTRTNNPSKRPELGIQTPRMQQQRAKLELNRSSARNQLQSSKLSAPPRPKSAAPRLDPRTTETVALFTSTRIGDKNLETKFAVMARCIDNEFAFRDSRTPADREIARAARDAAEAQTPAALKPLLGKINDLDRVVAKLDNARGQGKPSQLFTDKRFAALNSSVAPRAFGTQLLLRLNMPMAQAAATPDTASGHKTLAHSLAEVPALIGSRTGALKNAIAELDAFIVSRKDKKLVPHAKELRQALAGVLDEIQRTGGAIENLNAFATAAKDAPAKAWQALH